MSAVDIFGCTSCITRYRVRIQVTDKLVGGVPSSPSIIKGWLQSRMDIKDRALQELVDATLQERFSDRQPTADELADAVMQVGDANVNGFKRIPGTGELAYEGRCMKAALKEWANSAYPGARWPSQKKVDASFRKGLKSALAERVFVEETLIGLGVSAPSAIEERIKHVSTPQGPRSSITRVEVVDRPALEFTLQVRDDFLSPEEWGRIWEVGELIGIGADRARSDGRFTLELWERI